MLYQHRYFGFNYLQSGKWFPTTFRIWATSLPRTVAIFEICRGIVWSGVKIYCLVQVNMRSVIRYRRQLGGRK